MIIYDSSILRKLLNIVKQKQIRKILKKNTRFAISSRHYLRTLRLFQKKFKQDHDKL